MAKKIEIMRPQAFAYYHQKMKSYINSLPWGPSNNGMAGLFDIALPDEYDIQADTDAAQAIYDGLNLDGFPINIGTSGISWKKPTVVIPDINWSSTVDDNYNLTANVNIGVAFADGSAAQKTVLLRKPGPGKLIAVRTEDGAYIDTGLTLNYGYSFKAKGYTQGGNVSVLMGAYSTNSLRTTLRILGGSQKYQSMWPANRELTGATAAMNLSKPFEYDQNGSRLIVMQDGKTYTFTYSNTTSGTANVPILLMTEAAGSTTYNNGVLYSAEIYDENDVLIRQFMPFKLSNNDIVMVDIRGLTAQHIFDIVQNGTSAEYGDRVYYPSTGTLLEAA